ncbi:MAG: ErfK/YbiS/YcfS/YnhG family protein, partial [Gemmatimonadetes bacterium]|nr:ErfK/YbiS/YcfS/YnhG family protein [Gemmatimonadota bacterium]
MAFANIRIMSLSSTRRISPVRRKTFAAAGAVVLAAALASSAAVRPSVPAVHAERSVKLVANLSSRKIEIHDGDSITATYAVAVGKGSKPTPSGQFFIRKIVWNPRWVPPDEPWARGKTPQPPGADKNPMKLVKLFFQEPDYYI